MNRTKIIQGIMLFAIAVILLLPVVHASDVQKHIVPTLLRYQPVPAEPGNFIDVWLLVTNQRETVNDLDISITPAYPFRLSEDEEANQTIASIPSLQQFLIKYRVFVDLDARNEQYNLTWVYHYDQQGGLFHYEAPIMVQATDASLTVEHYTITPTPLRPGGNATLTLTLRNNGKLILKDVDVNLDLSGTTGATFSTYETGTIHRIPVIGPGDRVDVTYQVISDPKTETRIHSFPVQLTFRDERNNRYNASSRVTAIVNAVPRLLVTVEESGLAKANSTGDVTFKIINNGASDLKFLTLRLEPSADFDLLSPSSTAYLGNLDADDFETAQFKIQAKTLTPVFPITIDYADPYNNRFSQTFRVPLHIVDLKALEANQSSRTVIGAIIAVLAIVIVWFARKYLKKLQK